MNLFAKQKQTHNQHIGILGRERGGRRINWEIETDIYTLLCIKYIMNENLLYSTGNSTQCSEGPK